MTDPAPILDVAIEMFGFLPNLGVKLFVAKACGFGVGELVGIANDAVIGQTPAWKIRRPFGGNAAKVCRLQRLT